MKPEIKSSKLPAIIPIFITFFYSHAFAQSGYVCAAKESSLTNNEIHKFVLIKNDELKRFELKENISIKKDSVCTENEFDQGKTEIICLGSRFYFSLYVEDKEFMVSYWKKNTPEKEKYSSAIFNNNNLGQKYTNEDTKKLKPALRTGKCDIF